MRAAKERKRLESDALDYPAELPLLRRKIIIIDYDFGEQIHVLELRRSERIDCYAVYVDGHLWKEQIGFSRILAGIRKSMRRVKSLKAV